MSNSDANQRCMICRAIGFVIAAIVVGLITWWLFGKVAAWLAILAFLGLFAFGLWLVLKYCGEPVGYDHGTAHGSTVATGAAAAGVAGAAAASAASSGETSSAQSRADADAQAAKIKADADAAAAKAKADADAAEAEAAAKAKADADAAAAKAKADADAAAAATADAAQADKSAELEAARVKAELDAAKAKAEAEKAAAAVKAPVSREKSVADNLARGGGAGSASAGSVGTKPQGLSAARSGGADDLKRIKGVGPKMENMLNGMGYYHFDQVADWGDQEVAWVDDNLEGFKGRVTRDRWVPQARLLAGGSNVSDDVLEKIKSGENVDLTDYDGDGVSEGSGEGSRPAALDGPRGGKADNLKEIKGVGPKMEKMLHGMGFYHFDQVAAWTAQEVAWVDANLEGFKGRVSRDEWVKQAKILASGGETEFSQRVEDGDVY